MSDETHPRGPGSRARPPAASKPGGHVPAGPHPAEELLGSAVAALGSKDGALYRVIEGADPELLAATGVADDNAASRADMARHAADEGRPRLAPLPAGPAAGAPVQLAVPCRLEGRITAVLVVRLAHVDAGQLGGLVAALGSTLPLALLADHARIRATLEEHREQAAAIQSQLEAYAVDLRATYSAERTRSAELAKALDELAETYRATVRGLAIAVEAKDEYTGGHLYRVTRYGLAMTSVVAPEHVNDPQFEYGFLLHDVGKLTVPDAILTKPGKLSEEEWTRIHAHPEEGRNILANIPFLTGAREIVYCHHERWDGRGYPRNLAGDEIPLGARIFPLADAFDAMTSNRPYRDAMPVESAVEELRQGAGTQFWPVAIEAFLTLDPEELRLVSSENP